MTDILYTRQFFINVIKDMEKMVEANHEHLTKLDSAIGDGDHGVNLTIGFREVRKKLDEINHGSDDIAAMLRKVGMILLGKVGGSSGPLYGSFFMKAGKGIGGKNEVTFTELCNMIINGTEAIRQRGKAEIGDKTMIDAFIPGIEYLDKEKETPNEEIIIFEKFVDLMREGAESTIPLIARKGRAMRLGERAIGHKDPGAESAWMLMNVISENVKETAGK